MQIPSTVFSSNHSPFHILRSIPTALHAISRGAFLVLAAAALVPVATSRAIGRRSELADLNIDLAEPSVALSRMFDLAQNASISVSNSSSHSYIYQDNIVLQGLEPLCVADMDNCAEGSISELVDGQPQGVLVVASFYTGNCLSLSTSTNYNFQQFINETTREEAGKTVAEGLIKSPNTLCEFSSAFNENPASCKLTLQVKGPGNTQDGCENVTVSWKEKVQEYQEGFQTKYSDPTVALIVMGSSFVGLSAVALAIRCTCCKDEPWFSRGFNNSNIAQLHAPLVLIEKGETISNDPVIPGRLERIPEEANQISEDLELALQEEKSDFINSNKAINRQ